MSFIGNIAAAQSAKALGKYNQSVYNQFERPRFVDQQEQQYASFFVNALRTGAEYREGTTPFFVGIQNRTNQMLDLALSDYNNKVTVNDMVNQSLLLQARGRGELFKGKLTARAEYMKAAGSLLTMGYESDKQGRLVIL